MARLTCRMLLFRAVPTLYLPGPNTLSTAHCITLLIVEMAGLEGERADSVDRARWRSAVSVNGYRRVGNRWCSTRHLRMIKQRRLIHHNNLPSSLLTQKEATLSWLQMGVAKCTCHTDNGNHIPP